MRFKNLGRYQTGGTQTKMQLGIPLPQTPEGRVYRYSPNADAHPRHFVLGPADEAFVVQEEKRARMKLTPRSKQTVCPYSGVIGDDDEFTHPDDRGAAKEIVGHLAIQDVEEHLHKLFSGLNSKFIKVETKKTFRPKPRFTRLDLQRALVCDCCGRDYGVFAIALFCPDCGAPNIRLHFAREIELVNEQVELATAQAGEANELGYRLLGNAHEDVLTAFEATLKGVYLYGAQRGGTPLDAIRPVKNDFQNVEFGNKRFSELGLNPFSCLNEQELGVIKLNIQKRHIIGHNLGVMDDRFATHAEDARVGETVSLVADEVREFASLCQRVIDGLDDWLCGLPTPASELAGDAATTKESTVATSTKKPPVDDIGLNISPLAVRIAKFVCQSSETGFSDMISDAALAAEFPNDNQAELSEAIAELEMDGYITTIKRGRNLPYTTPTLDLFATFDPHVMGSDPLKDSVELVKLILASQENVNSASLHEQSGMTLRRFNPALGFIVAQIDDRHVSKEVNRTYPSRFLLLDATDRVSLRRFMERSEG